MKTEDLRVYELAMTIGEDVWLMTYPWDYFAKSTLGKQLVRAADSIALNIAEGDGRYFFKERNVFFYYSRGSAFETKCCTKKAAIRGLINDDQYNNLNEKLVSFTVQINALIKAVKNKSETQ